MKYRHLKKVDIKLSELGLGTWAIGGPYWTDNQSTGWTGPLDEDEIIAATQIALEAGVNHIDTADVYGYGNAERLIGRATKGISRESIVIASKVGWVKTSAPNPFTKQNIRYQCEQSLRNLQTDYIDIYYFHHCDFGPGDSFLPEAIATMEELRAEGKIRCVGVSGYSEADLLRIAKAVQPAVIQSWADIEHDEFVREGSTLRLFMDENDILFVPMMPYAQGRLLGKYSYNSPPQFEDGDNRKGSSAFSSESLRELEPRLNALREHFGKSTADMARVALQFLLANPAVVSVIPGFRNTVQIRANIAAAGKAITREEMEYILKVFPRAEMGPHPWVS
jgi:aryl-alcohol dehydrogenase-like predicted oxidoreductase